MELSGRVDGGGRSVGEEEFDVGSLNDLGENSRVDVPDLDEVGVEGHDPRVVKSCEKKGGRVSEGDREQPDEKRNEPKLVGEPSQVILQRTSSRFLGPPVLHPFLFT